MNLALGSAQAQAPTISTPSVPASYALDAIDFRQAGLLDRLCVVEAKGYVHETRASGTAQGGSAYADASVSVSVEEGTVVDGPGKGGDVRASRRSSWTA